MAEQAAIASAQQAEPTPAGYPAQQNTEKTFTQAELDAIVGKRVSKAMKGMPDEAELNAFRQWKESQQSEAERINAIQKERDEAKTSLTAALAKLEQYEREKLLLSKGVPTEYVDYYAFKIAQMVTDSKDFDHAADEFIASRATQQSKIRVDLGASLAGNSAEKTPNDAMNMLIRKLGK